MEKPTLDELVIYASVREYLRWDRPVLERDLETGDDLIRGGDDSVTFGFVRDKKAWSMYVAGYFNAARALLEGPPDRFFLMFAIYPVLFLYRHYIELEIKNLMMRTSEILQIPHPNFGTDHDLLSLWSKFKQMLPAAHSALQNAANIERILGQFSTIDPKSMDTRYGLQRDLLTSTVATPVDISISNLRQTMDRLEGEFRVLDAVVETVEQDRIRQQHSEV